MKKEILVVTVAIIIIGLSAFISNIKTTGYSVLDNENITESDKIDENIFQYLDNETEVKVIVVLNEPIENKISGFVTLEQDNNIKEIYDYDIVNAISANITLEGLQELKKDPNVKYVYLDHRFIALLQDSINIVNASRVHNIKINPCI